MVNICQRCNAGLKNAEERLHGLCAKHIKQENAKIYKGHWSKDSHYAQRLPGNGREKRRRKTT